MKENKRAFKGIWITKEIWLSDKLTTQEKIFLAEISSLDTNDKCFASNNYFSKFFGISKSRVSEVINSLIKKGFLTSEHERKGRLVTRRILRCSEKYNTPFGKGDDGGLNPEGGYSEKERESNNTNNNNTNNNTNTDTTKKEILIPDTIQGAVIAFLNKTANKSYKYDGILTLKYIDARLDDGFVLADFKKVIESKVNEWKSDPKMCKFITPSTLFGTKFEGYLNAMPDESDPRYKLWYYHEYKMGRFVEKYGIKEHDLLLKTFPNEI